MTGKPGTKPVNVVAKPRISVPSVTVSKRPGTVRSGGKKNNGQRQTSSVAHAAVRENVSRNTRPLGDAQRRGAKPPKSALLGDAKRRGAKPRKSVSTATPAKAVDPPKRSRVASDKRHPKGVRKAVSTKSHPNYKGYDAIDGKPERLDKRVCKERPSEKQSKGGGGGRKGEFIPWCK